MSQKAADDDLFPEKHFREMNQVSEILCSASLIRRVHGKLRQSDVRCCHGYLCHRKISKRRTTRYIRVVCVRLERDMILTA